MPITINGSTGIAGVNGSAATPSVQGTDTNTGVWFPAADTVSIATNGTEAMRVDSSGNVGIGTTTPLWTSANRGDVTINGSTDAVLVLSKSNNVNTSSYLYYDGTNLIQNVQSNGYMSFNTNATERARITGAGDFLVGTTAISNTAGVLITKGGAANGGVIQLMKTASGATNGLLCYYGSTYVGGINYDNTSTSFPTSSDLRLKTNIVDAEKAIDKLNAIHIVSHGWKNDAANVEFGVIAQELVNIAPQAVVRGDDGEEIETAWGVDYSKLVPMLIKSVQELNTKVDRLQAEINALKGAA